MAPYKVGKGRPPQHTRWKPGQSGNPRGRPKGGQPFHRMLVDELNKVVQVKIKGAVKRLTKAELIAHQLTRAALKGDPIAAGFIFTRERLFPEELVPTAEAPAASKESAEAVYARIIKKN